jgi:hypothetical protein
MSPPQLMRGRALPALSVATQNNDLKLQTFSAAWYLECFGGSQIQGVINEPVS